MSEKKRYTLYLISPRQRFVNYPAHSEMAKMFGKRRLMIPLALPTIASLTPDTYDIRIFDEEIEELPKNGKPDIVAITTLAATGKRAFELGDAYRAAGAKVVFGGPYASFIWEEALKHGDCVIAGEAEGKWEQCLTDFENGCIKQVYESQTYVTYKSQKPPRWDLVNTKRIFQVAIQVSRGCPFNCDFCLVSKNFGQTMRYRDIANVVEEIKAAPSKYFFFVDDNLTINKKYAKELMRAIIPLKISWGCMCSLDVATDDELLRLMADAGCFNILVGFESLNPDSLDESQKHHNRGGKIYAEAINKIHAAGIHINASFVVGFDSDTLDEFDRIFDFSMKHNLPNVNLHLLNAPPGTETHRKLSEEGRLLSCDPELGVGHFPTLQYMNMSQIEIFDKYMETITKLYSFDTIRKKGEALFSNGAFTRPGGEISALMKARLSWITFKEFVLTRDPDRKKLFFFILNLIRTKKIAIDKGLGFLLSMLGYNRHIREHQRNMAEYRRIVMAQDKGAWKQKAINLQPTRKIQKIGIIGEGKMGSAIFNYLLDFNFDLVWICSSDADTDKIIRQFGKRIKRSMEAGIIDRQRLDVLMQTPITKNVVELNDCDLIIEAIPEILDLKRNLFNQLDTIVKADSIFTSNSSSINPSALAPPGGRKVHFAGLHFFYPVPFKNIVEFTITPETSNQTITAVEEFLHAIGRRSITLDEKNSFILNKIFLDFQNEAYRIVLAGNCTHAQIDQLVKKHFFHFGVFDFCDSVGIDTMLASIQNYTRDYPHKDYYGSFITALNDLALAGKFGVKSQEGFYTYPNEGVTDEFPAGSDGIVEHLRQTWLSASKRYTAQSHLPIEDMNWAIKEYFSLEKGPFE
jgi:3-hydroxyacyl-CoA dehydrogenase/radical SAM superfamily enzyme YgiQ (UPF0313 family)